MDLCFLETVTSEMDGLELARTLRAGGYKGEIAFLTELNCYAHEAYRVKAIDYLLKPVMHEKIQRAISRVVEDKRVRAEAFSPVIYSTIETVPHREISRLDRVKQFLYELLN